MELPNTHAHTHGIHTRIHTQKQKSRNSRKEKKGGEKKEENERKEGEEF